MQRRERLRRAPCLIWRLLLLLLCSATHVHVAVAFQLPGQTAAWTGRRPQQRPPSIGTIGSSSSRDSGLSLSCGWTSSSSRRVWIHTYGCKYRVDPSSQHVHTTNAHAHDQDQQAAVPRRAHGSDSSRNRGGGRVGTAVTIRAAGEGGGHAFADRDPSGTCVHVYGCVVGV